MEKNFDNRAILLGTFDFVTCKRADGSIYGNGGAQCKKGSETTKEDIQKVITARNKVVSGNAASLLSNGVSKDAFGPEISKSSIKAAEEQIGVRSKEIASKMKNGEDLSKEIDNFIVNRNFIGDPRSAEHIVLGIEEGTPKGTKAGDEYNEFLAKKIAINEYKSENTGREERLAADVVNGNVDKELDFHRKHAMALTTATGDVVSPSDVFMAGGKVAQVEARSMPASMEGKWEIQGQKYAKNAGIDSRDEYVNKYKDKMDANATKRIIDAVDNNPNLKSVVLAQRGAITDKVVADLSSRPGARSREFKYDVNAQGLKGTGQIIDPTGTGKPLIYNYGRSVSGFGKVDFNSHMAGSAFASESAKLLAGQTTPVNSVEIRRRARMAKKEAEAQSRQQRQTRTSRSSNTSRASSNNKKVETSKPPITSSQREQRKAQLEGLLEKAKKDKNSGFIAQLEGMLKAL